MFYDAIGKAMDLCSGKEVILQTTMLYHEEGGYNK